MCKFFSFVTDPVNHPAEYYYFDWEYRKANLIDDDADSHSHICKEFNLREDVCNKYEFNPLTKMFTVDQINSGRDDSEAAEKWANRLNFKEIVEPLIVKPIVNPCGLPKVEQVTDEQIGWLKDWTSVWNAVWDSAWSSGWSSVWGSVGDSVWNGVWDSVSDSVRNAVWNAVWDSIVDSVVDSVWNGVWDSVSDSVRAYVFSFFDVEYKFDFSSAIKLWESGLVPSFDGTIWRLHSGKNADIVFEWMPEVQE